MEVTQGYIFLGRSEEEGSGTGRQPTGVGGSLGQRLGQVGRARLLATPFGTLHFVLLSFGPLCGSDL